MARIKRQRKVVATDNGAGRAKALSIDQTQRTRDLLQQITRSSPTEIDRWSDVDGSVALLLERDAAATENGQLAFFTALNLLLRLHPVVTRIELAVEGDPPILKEVPLLPGSTVVEAAKSFYATLRPKTALSIMRDDSRARGCRVVLAAGCVRRGKSISFSSDGWNVFLSAVTANPFGSQFNPVGSMVAAAFATSEAFKRVLIYKARKMGVPRANLPHIALADDSIRFSTFRYSNDTSLNPPLPSPLSIGALSVIGVGAGGGACLYALATLKLGGDLWIVDPDVVNSHNLNRYLYAVDADAERLAKKVVVVSEFFRHHQGLNLHASEQHFKDFKTSNPDWPRDLVLSAADTADIRRAIQWETPRITLDAAVGQGVFYIHRVELGRSACLICTHSSEHEQPDIIGPLASALGLDPGELGKAYFDNLPLDCDLLSRIGQSAHRIRLPSPQKGMTLRDWITMHCGQLQLKGSADLVLPVPFAVVLPGILLAGEIIKERYFPAHVLRDRANHDVFGEPGGWLVTPYNKKPGCPLCGDQTVMAVYRGRYGDK